MCLYIEALKTERELCNEIFLKMDIFFSKFFERDKNSEHVSLTIEVTHKDIMAYGIQNDVALRSYRITKEAWDSVFK